MTKRMAVLLTGQARTWRTCVPNIRNFFSNIWYGGQEVAVDYFIHTWDADSWRERTGAASEIVPLVATSEELRRAYDAISVEIDPLPETRPGAQWTGMFESLNRANHLKTMHEIEQGFVYDIVVKTRFDTIFDPATHFPIHDVIPLVAYTSMNINKFYHEYFSSEFHDIIFYADSPTMDMVADMSRSYKRLMSPEANFRLHHDINDNGCFRLGPGTLLWRHLVNRGISPECRAHFDYTIVRKSSEAQGFDSISDFNKLRSLHLAWYR